MPKRDRSDSLNDWIVIEGDHLPEQRPRTEEKTMSLTERMTLVGLASNPTLQEALPSTYISLSLS